MRLHRDMRIQVIKSTIRLLTPLVPAFVHALDFFISTTRSFVLLRSWNRNERVHLRERVGILGVP